MAVQEGLIDLGVVGLPRVSVLNVNEFSPQEQAVHNLAKAFLQRLNRDVSVETLTNHIASIIEIKKATLQDQKVFDGIDIKGISHARNLTDFYRGLPLEEIPAEIVILSKPVIDPQLSKNPHKKTLVVIDEGVVGKGKNAEYQFSPFQKAFLGKKKEGRRPDVYILSLSQNTQRGMNRETIEVTGAENILYGAILSPTVNSAIKEVHFSCTQEFTALPESILGGKSKPDLTVHIDAPKLTFI